LNIARQLEPKVSGAPINSIRIGSNASEPAKALQALLSAPAAAPVIRKNGMAPNHP
jgi:hypothetical protein